MSEPSYPFKDLIDILADYLHLYFGSSLADDRNQRVVWEVGYRVLLYDTAGTECNRTPYGYLDSFFGVVMLCYG